MIRRSIKRNLKMKPESLIMLITKKTTHLMAGYTLYGLGIVMTINANQGLAPWDVFHQGLSNQFGISMGMATQITGAGIVIVDILFNERIGWGTIGNAIFILIAEEDAILKQINQAAKNKKQVHKRMVKEMERKADGVYEEVNTLVQSLLLISGYRMHQGQWRKRRE